MLTSCHIVSYRFDNVLVIMSLAEYRRPSVVNVRMTNIVSWNCLVVCSLIHIHQHASCIATLYHLVSCVVSVFSCLSMCPSVLNTISWKLLDTIFTKLTSTMYHGTQGSASYFGVKRSKFRSWWNNIYAWNSTLRAQTFSTQSLASNRSFWFKRQFLWSWAG